MTIETLIMTMGAFVALLPFLGFPIAWDNFLLMGAGAIIIALGVMVRRRAAARSRAVQSPSLFVESAPQVRDTHEAS